MNVLYRGNFQPDLPDDVTPWSTETHVAASLEAEGHTVIRCQEDRVDWSDTVAMAEDADVLWWTSTYGMAHKWDQDVAHEAVDKLKGMLPTVAHHLDRFWGLDREGQVETEPWFRLHLVCTADGDNDDRWQQAGVNHVWVRPAVYHAEVGRGTPRSRFRSEVAFVGNWRGGYHREWPFRRELVHHLRTRWRGRVGLWPKPGEGAVRGQALNDLYASVDVVVGDSCFADRAEKYMSDRLFETVGRGGLLLFPGIEAAADELEDREHVVYYQPGNLDHLDALIGHYLDAPDEREAIVEAGVERVRAACTYRHRVREIVGHLQDGGWL